MLFDDYNGYFIVYAPENPRANSSGHVNNCVIVAEKALGRYLDRKNRVHHVNEIKSDDSNSNLVICEDENYHRLIHARTRVAKAGGDPDKEKICSKCKKVLSFYHFYSRFIKQKHYYSDECKLCATQSAKNRQHGIYKPL